MRLQPPSRPQIVAHRGASAHRAEHTLAAYAVALEHGADGLECDVRLTRDGHLVCVHDPRVDRTSTGRGRVSELDLDTMSTLDYGSWHDEFETADELIERRVAEPPDPPDRRGLLTLADLLGLVVDWPDPVRLFIETKHPVRYAGLVEAKLVALLARHGLSQPESKADSRAVMMSFSSRAVRRFALDAPRLPTVLLMRRPERLPVVGPPPWADITGPSIRLLRDDPGLVAWAAERGRLTYCWTVNDPADMALCRELGVHYVCTDRPAAARELLD